MATLNTVSPQPLDVLRVSASAPAPGVRRTAEVVKLIDTSTCIGCKACEVACQEWNDLPPETTVQLGTYQTLPDTTSNFWNLIRFNEHEDERGFHWLMRKDQCMHCAEPGCLEACPAPGAIVQYTNGIVDFNQDQCIGCGLCMSGCPFNVPKFSPETKRVYKCTMCVDRTSVGLEPACVKSCPTSCLQFGTKDAMLQVANHRVEQLKANGYEQAAVYDPPGVGGTGVITVLSFGDKPELYGLPKNPMIPLSVRAFRGPLRWTGNLGMLAGVVLAAVHYVRVGRKDQHLEDAQPAPSLLQAKPKERRLVRYAFNERLTHTVAGLSYLYLLFTGLALWTPALYWLATLTGGGFASRVLHPWVGLLFSAAVWGIYRLWQSDMGTTEADKAWRKALPAYVSNDEAHVPPAGKFNYGQKQLFWVMVWGALAMLVSGIVLWFPEAMPIVLRPLAVFIHALAAIVTIAGFIVHIYMGIAVVPGSMHAILHGDVTEAWAKRHHPLWAEQVENEARGNPTDVHR